MGLDRQAASARRQRRRVGLAALLVTFSAVALVLDRSKCEVEMWFALPLFVIGVALFVWIVWLAGHVVPKAEATPATRVIRS